MSDDEDEDEAWEHEFFDKPPVGIPVEIWEIAKDVGQYVEWRDQIAAIAKAIMEEREGKHEKDDPILTNLMDDLESYVQYRMRGQAMTIPKHEAVASAGDNGMVERCIEAAFTELERQHAENLEPYCRRHSVNSGCVDISGLVGMKAVIGAVILALREPTAEMVEAAKGYVVHAVPEDVWQAMIDAALKP